MELDPLIVKLILDSTGYKSGLAGAQTQTNTTGASLKSVLSGVGLSGVASFLSITGAIAGTVVLLKACIKTSMEYAQTIKEMSLLNGTSIDETARLIVITGRYDVSLQDLELASRTLAKGGLSLTVDTLKDLSDQYNALATADEKQAFLMATFGARGGTAFVQLMEQGGTAIGEQARNVSDALIPNAAFLQMTENQKDATYDMSLAWKGFMVQVSTEILPGLTSLTKGLVPVINALTTISSLIGRGAKPGALTSTEGLPEKIGDWIEHPNWFRNTPKSPDERGFAGGTQGWTQVPDGFPGDSYKIGLTSGETFAVNNNSTTNNNMLDYRKLARAIRDALNT